MSREYNIRYQYKNIYLYYFFKWFNKNIFKHYLSILFNSLFNVKKERILLKQRIIQYFNVNNIGTIVYKNTLKNIFITLTNNKGKVLYSISSGLIGFFGKKKTYHLTVTNITKRFLFGIKTIWPYKKIHAFKLVLKGSLLYINNFFSVIKGRARRFDRDSKLINNVFNFFKKYLFFIKNKILSQKKKFLINLNYYIRLLNHVHIMFHYMKLRPIHNDYISFNILFIQRKKNKPFIH